MKALYTYVCVPNTVLTEGLKSPALLPAEKLYHYAGRAGSDQKRAILDWLETVFPGRSRAVSLLTEPVPDTQNTKINGFAARRECFRIPVKVIANPEIVEAVYCFDKDAVTQISGAADIDFSPLNWAAVKENDDVFFKLIRHYMVVLKTGILPAELLEKF